MTWTVTVSRKAVKGCRVLPSAVAKILELLMLEIEKHGPVRGDWPNYSKLGPGRHHCHLKKGRPTYVAVWEEKNGRDQRKIDEIKLAIKEAERTGQTYRGDICWNARESPILTT